MSDIVSITASQPRLSITEAVARSYGMEAKAFEMTLRATVVPKECTREEFAAFLLVAREYGLNPILREIYAFPKKGGGIQPIVGVDGWSAMLARHPQFNGMIFRDHIDNDGTLVAITCQMHRRDRDHPIEATEYLEECRRKTEPWDKWPKRMLRHKAMIQAARYAFGFSGVVEPDEYDRFGAAPHDPAMLRAGMQLEHDSFASAMEASREELDELPFEDERVGD
jgi:phage recombination protein Bet